MSTIANHKHNREAGFFSQTEESSSKKFEEPLCCSSDTEVGREEVMQTSQTVRLELSLWSGTLNKRILLEALLGTVVRQGSTHFPKFQKMRCSKGVMVHPAIGYTFREMEESLIMVQKIIAGTESGKEMRKAMHRNYVSPQY